MGPSDRRSPAPADGASNCGEFGGGDGDGRRIISGSYDKTVAIWDPEGGTRIHQLSGHQDPVSSVVVCRDGRHIVSGSWDRTVAVWDVESGARVHQLTGHHGEVSSVGVSPRRAARRLGLPRPDGGGVGSPVRCTAAPSDRSPGAVRSVAVSPDGRHIVSGSHDSRVAVWDLESGARLHVLSGHRDWVRSVATSGDGLHIVSGPATARWWCGTSSPVLGPHPHPLRPPKGVNSVAVSPDGCPSSRVQRRHGGGVGPRVRRTPPPTHRSPRSGEVRGGESDGRHIVSGSDDRTVAVWDFGTGVRFTNSPATKSV